MVTKTSRRAFIGVAATAAATLAATGGLKYFTSQKTPLEFEDLGFRDWELLNSHLDVRARKETDIGRQTTEMLKILQTPKGLQSLGEIADMGVGYTRDHQGIFEPFTDGVGVGREGELKTIEQAQKGIPTLLLNTHHEITHFALDQHNPLEKTIDLIRKAGIKLKLEDDPHTIKEELDFELISGATVQDNTIKSKNAYTRFVIDYMMQEHQNDFEQIRTQQIVGGDAKALIRGQADEAFSKVLQFRNKMGEGGLVLTEVMAAMRYTDADYEWASPQSLRAEMQKGMSYYVGGDNPDFFNQAYDGVESLYAIYSAKEKGNPLKTHLRVCEAVGRSLLSWDENEKRFTELAAQKNTVMAELGWDEKRLTQERVNWTDHNITARRKDQQKVKAIADQEISRMLRERGGK